METELKSLQDRVVRLERRVLLLTGCCAVLIAFTVFFSTQAKVTAAAQPETLTVKRLVVVDDKGTERVVIAAPLPDPMIGGKRVKRAGPVSGILILDPKGNERGGYVTADSADLGAFLSLDSERSQVFTAYANADSGATISVANASGDEVVLSSYKQPVIEIVKRRKVLYKQPPDAPDLR